MPDASQTSQNIKRSVQEYLAGLSLGAPLLFDATLDQVPNAGQWVDVVWRKRTMTPHASPDRSVVWVLTLDCWSRIKDDPMQSALDALTDALLAGLRDGQRDKLVTLNDYADPSSPVATSYKVRLSVQSDDYLPSTDLVYGRSITVEVHYFERF